MRGRDGRDGRDGLPGPAGRDGKDGEKGQKGDPGLQSPQGAEGEKGEKGQKGEAGNSGIVYTRWGKKNCTSVQGTELVYNGRTGGSWYNKGGAANYLCMPTNPQYSNYAPGVQGYSYVYGA